MSAFEMAMHNYAALPHGIEKLNCLRAALLAHQTISVAAMGKTDDGLNSQIKEIGEFLLCRSREAANYINEIR